MWLNYWGIERYGYKPTTSIWNDFTAAEHYDLHEIVRTYRSIHERWKQDLHELTELSMVLLSKSIGHVVGPESRLYIKLFALANKYIVKYANPHQLQYYWEKVHFSCSQSIDDNKFLQLYYVLDETTRENLMRIKSELDYWNIDQNTFIEYLRVNYFKKDKFDVYTIGRHERHRLNEYIRDYEECNRMIHNVIAWDQANNQ